MRPFDEAASGHWASLPDLVEYSLYGPAEQRHTNRHHHQRKKSTRPYRHRCRQTEYSRDGAIIAPHLPNAPHSKRQWRTCGQTRIHHTEKPCNMAAVSAGQAWFCGAFETCNHCAYFGCPTGEGISHTLQHVACAKKRYGNACCVRRLVLLVVSMRTQFRRSCRRKRWQPSRGARTTASNRFPADSLLRAVHEQHDVFRQPTLRSLAFEEKQTIK